MLLRYSTLHLQRSACHVALLASSSASFASSSASSSTMPHSRRLLSASRHPCPLHLNVSVTSSRLHRHHLHTSSFSCISTRSPLLSSSSSSSTYHGIENNAKHSTTSHISDSIQNDDANQRTTPEETNSDDDVLPLVQLQVESTLVKDVTKEILQQRPSSRRRQRIEIRPKSSVSAPTATPTLDADTLADLTPLLRPSLSAESSDELNSIRVEAPNYFAKLKSYADAYHLAKAGREQTLLSKEQVADLANLIDSFGSKASSSTSNTSAASPLTDSTPSRRTRSLIPSRTRSRLSNSSSTSTKSKPKSSSSTTTTTTTSTPINFDSEPQHKSEAEAREFKKWQAIMEEEERKVDEEMAKEERWAEEDEDQEEPIEDELEQEDEQEEDDETVPVEDEPINPEDEFIEDDIDEDEEAYDEDDQLDRDSEQPSDMQLPLRPTQSSLHTPRHKRRTKEEEGEIRDGVRTRTFNFGGEQVMEISGIDDDEDGNNDVFDEQHAKQFDMDVTATQARLNADDPEAQIGRGVGGVFFTRKELMSLNEKDLIESFTKGSGKGGQKVNKTNSCVQLLHLPTGTRVKCQFSRDLQANRARARTIMRDRLEELLLGTESRTALKAAKERKKKDRNRRRRAKKLADQAAAEAEEEDAVDDEGEQAPAAPQQQTKSKKRN